jgi:hypothetical protein
VSRSWATELKPAGTLLERLPAWPGPVQVACDTLEVNVAHIPTNPADELYPPSVLALPRLDNYPRCTPYLRDFRCERVDPPSAWTKVFVFLALYAPVPASYTYRPTLSFMIFCFGSMCVLYSRRRRPCCDRNHVVALRNLGLSIRHSSIGPHSRLPCCPSLGVRMSRQSSLLRRVLEDEECTPRCAPSKFPPVLYLKI